MHQGFLGRRLQLGNGLQPLQDGFPLVQIGLNGGIALVKDGLAAIQAAHINLGLAQNPQKRDVQAVRPCLQCFGCAGAGVYALANDAYFATSTGRPAGAGPSAHKCRQRRIRGQTPRVADRDQNGVCRHHHFGQLETVYAARRVQHHMGDPHRHFQYIFLDESPERDVGLPSGWPWYFYHHGTGGFWIKNLYNSSKDRCW